MRAVSFCTILCLARPRSINNNHPKIKIKIKITTKPKSRIRVRLRVRVRTKMRQPVLLAHPLTLKHKNGMPPRRNHVLRPYRREGE
ncbi:hypothetical protein CJF30_00003110 [Rutstroemia sp. NJR-2017a BBW]|nr:hypothetical protein CJF30_00003110 [Rutstroemia sp. NJR-2017a BBW]